MIAWCFGCCKSFDHSLINTSTNLTIMKKSLLVLWFAFAGIISVAQVVSNGTGGGNWNDGATWTGGIIPTAATDVIISANDVVTINAAANVLNLTISGGAILQFESVAGRLFDAAGNVNIQANGTLRTSGTGSATSHNFRVVGNLVNEGTIDLHNGNTGANLVFRGGVNSLFSGTGAINDVVTLQTQKTTKDKLVEIDVSNFSVRGLTNGGTNGFLVPSGGTVKFSGTNSYSGPLSVPPNLFLNANSALWFNNPNFSIINHAGQFTVQGDLRLSAGVVSLGTTNLHNLLVTTGGTITVDGGTLNIASRCSLLNNSIYIQSGGEVNVSTVGNDGSLIGSFDANNAKILFSGGTLRLVQCNSNATFSDRRDYVCLAASQSEFTGGTLVFGTGNTIGNFGDFTFSAVGPAPGITIDNTGNPKSLNAVSTNFFSGIQAYGPVLINLFTNFNLNGQSCFFFKDIVNNGSITGSAAGSTMFIDGAGAVTYSGTGSAGFGIPIHTLNIATTSNFNINSSQNIFAQNIGLLNGNVVNSNKITLGNAINDVVVEIGSATLPGGSPGYFDVQPTYNMGTGRQTLKYFHGNGRTMGFEINPARRLFSMQTNMGNAPLIMAGGNVQVTGLFAFNTGKIDLNGDTLTVGTGPTGIQYGGLSPGINAVLFNGKYRKWIGDFDGSDYQFPVGIQATRRNAAIKFTTLPSTGGTLTAEWVNSAGGNNGLPLTQDAVTVNSTSTEGYWKINAANGLTGGVYKATLSATNITGVTDFSQLVVVKRSNANAAWELQGTHIATTGSNTSPILSRSNLSSFSDFGIGSSDNSGPLASSWTSQLIGFSATQQNNGVRVAWQTASEENSSHFLLLRSTNGTDFTTLATMKAAGNSTGKNMYSFNDLSALQLTSKALYYILQLEDKYGDKSYSKAIKIKLHEALSLLSVFPNPASDNVHFKLNSSGAFWQVTIVNGAGKLVGKYQVKAAPQVELPVNSLAPGTYFLKVFDGEKQHTASFIKR